MAKTDDTRPDAPRATTRGSGKPQRKSANGLTRRDFVRTGAAAGLGAGALLGPDQADAQGASTGLDDTTWDYEVDVVIAGAGCAGHETR